LIKDSLNTLQEIKFDHKAKIEKQIETITIFENKKKIQFDNSLLFYNSLSLIMLAMLTGGLIGVVYILFFTFRNDDKQ